MKTLKQLESFMWDYLPKVHGENFSDEKDFEKDLMTKLQKDGFDVESQLSTQSLNDDEKVKLFTAEGAIVPDLVVKVEEGFIPIELKFDNTPTLYKKDEEKICRYVKNFSDVPEAWAIFLDKHNHEDYDEGWTSIANSAYRYKWRFKANSTSGNLKLADVWNERRKNAGQGPKKTSSPLKSLLLLFALMIGIGNAWGATVSEGTYNWVNQTISAKNEFYKIDNGIYQYRLNGYSKNSNLGIQLPSGTGDGTGFVFHLESTQKVYIGIVKKSVKREVTNNLYIKTITEANFSAIEAGSNSSTTVTLTLGGSATLSGNYTFAAISSAKTEGATVYMGELPAGYYYAYGNSSNNEGNLYSITFGTQTLFLVPNDKTNDNAKFAIYYWMGATGYERQGWSDYMTVSPCNSSTYRADIPKGYTNVIFVRLDPSGGRNWNSKWNKTGDLTFDGTKDLFTWANGSWDDVTTTWSASTKYTISFAANGGTGSMSNVSSIACGRSVKLAANAYEKSGYVFAGWKTNVAVTANGEAVAANGIVADEATISNITSNITLTAQWNADVACTATQPGSISKSLSACTLTLTASGDPASNNTWYWQSAADGTATNLGTGATKTVTTTGTWYIRSYCSDGSGCWSEAQTVTVSASDLTPAAPTALAKSSVTAKGVTLTVTDAANTNDYEFYVNTSSSAPSAGTSASYTSTSKSVTITDKYAGTTFYAWARAKCGSNKSAWTALTGSTFTTSTVSAAYHLANVSKTSGAESGIGGSTFTAVFSANTDYSMPTPVVTIGGNAATSGTDYTWTEGTGTLTIAKEKITGNIDITLNSVPSAPSSAVISGTYHYFPGENISLTVTPSGNNGPTTYQWYKGGKADGNAIDGATSATFTKNICAFEDAGSYYCKVTCNATSIWANTNSSENYDVKILRLYVNGSRNGDAYGNVDFVKVDGTTATASIALGAGWTYGFSVADGCGTPRGNSGTMTENNCTGWTMNSTSGQCAITTTNAATYIFTVNYSNLSAPVVSVTYPVGNQAEGKVIYFDNNVLKWTGSSIYYRIGHSSHSQASQLSLVSGTANLYKMTTTEYNGFSGWHIANATGDVGSGKSIYKTVDGTPITEATAHEGGAVTESAITVTPTTSKGYGADEGVNDNCEFFNYTITSGMKTDNVAISPYSNGTITVNYTNTSGSAATLTSGNADLAHSVILTSITAVADEGYDASAITINGNAYAANYVVTGNTTIAASFTLKTYTISYNKGTNGTGSKASETKTHGVNFTLPGSTFTYGGHAQDGWSTSDGGALAYALSGSYTTNAAQEFFPHWKCNTPEISCSSNTITITVPTGATVYYTTTTDGSTPADPTSSSTAYNPSSKPTISADTKIKAIAIQSGCTNSAIASASLTYVAPGPSYTAPTSALDISAQTSVTAAALITAHNATQTHYLSTNTDTLLLIPSDIYYNIGNGKKNTWATANGEPSPTSADWSRPDGSVSFKGRTWWKSSANVNTLQVRSNRTLNIRVKGCKTVSVLNAAVNSTKYFIMEAYEYDDGYKSSDPDVNASNTSTSVTETSLSLDSSKEYVIVLRASTTDNVMVYEIKFIAPATPCTVAPTVSATTKGTTTSSTQVVNCAGISSLGTGTCTITSYGFVYGTSANPTLSNSHVEVGTSYTVTGTAFAETTLTGLTPSTTYYVRAYATNGAGTGYGDAVSFTTSAAPVGAPVITVQPTLSEVALGETASFSLTATGATSYQWYNCDSEGENKTEASGASATTDNYSYTTTATGTTYYICKVSNASGDTWSNVVGSIVTPVSFTIHYEAGSTKDVVYTNETFTQTKEVNAEVEDYIGSLTKYAFTGVNISGKGKSGTMSMMIDVVGDAVTDTVGKRVSFSFVIANNYQLDIDDIDFQVQAVTKDDESFQVVMTDQIGTTIVGTLANPANGTLTKISFPSAQLAKNLVGKVNVVLYGWCASSETAKYRIAKDIYITGTVSSLPAPTASWIARPASATVGDGGKTYTLTTDGTNTVAWSITDQSGATGATLSPTSGLTTTLDDYSAAGSLYVQASVTGDGIHYLSTPATLLRQRVVISGDCEEATLISATLSSCTGTGAVSGTPGGTSTVAFESCVSMDGGYKMGKNGSYMRLALTSGNFFAANDEVKITITNASNVGDGALHIYKYASETWTELGSVAAAGAGTYTYRLTESNVSTPFNTIGLYRTESNQNPYVKALSVVRNSCSASKPSSVTVTASPAGPYAIGATPTLTVTATNADTYQWYSNTNNTASDGFLLVGETATTYSPSTAIAGTTYYYCVATNASGSTVSNIITVTVNSAKTTPVVSWTGTDEEPNYGGGGYTVTATVSTGAWDGTLTTDMLTASDGVTLSGVSVSGKVITATYGVTETARSPLSFSLTLPETTNYTALAANKEITFTRCGEGAVIETTETKLPVKSSYTTASNPTYRWETDGVGWLTLVTGSSTLSSTSDSYSGFSYRSSSGKSSITFYSELDAVSAVRIYIKGGGSTTLSKVQKGTTFGKYTQLAPSTDYDYSYSNGSSSIESREQAYIEITFKTALSANTFVEITLSRNTEYYGVGLITGNSEVGNITTALSWATNPGTTVNKYTTDANFRYEAVKASDVASQATLGTISYKSSVPAVATVSATGVVDILSEGTTTITATLAGSGCYKKATLSYNLVVAAATCTDVAGTITASGSGITIDGNTVTKADACAAVTLTVSGHTGENDGATYQWYKDGESLGGSFQTKSISVTDNGDYTVEVTNAGDGHCTMPATNTITITGNAISITKIVDEWYVKNGRRTPDIALATIEGTTSYTVNDGISDITTFAGCGFELRDGILYLKGTQDDGSAPSGLAAGDVTLTITAVSACGDDPTATITIHKQVKTAKRSIAFIVDGTKGDPVNSVATTKTSSRPIWIYLSEFFDLTGCNAYWTNNEKLIRQYYSQFDAIVITDDPSTDEKPKSGLKYVNALGTMVDVRPILTMEAYVGKYGASSNWHIGGTPSSPNPRQYELKLQCKDHDIFSDLTPSANFRSEEIDGETYYYVTMVDNSVTPYAGLADDAETETYPALQGFSAASIKGTGLLGIGTISDGTLQGGVERQDEPTARMMILGIQHQAMAALTSEGKQVIKNAINYLLKTDMEEVDDCSNYFIGGTVGHEQEWHTASNWSSTKVPDASTKARIMAPVTISTTVHVAQVDIAVDGRSIHYNSGNTNCSGSVTIASTGALIVEGQVRRTTNGRLFTEDELEPTTPADLTIQTSPSAQGALIFDNSEGETQATVVVRSKANKDEGTRNWQYLTSPLQETPVTEFFYGVGTYTYKHSEAEGGWVRYNLGTTFHAFDAIGLTQEAAKDFVFYGPLAPTGEWNLSLTHARSGNNLFGNSWTAPIDLKALVRNTDFDGNIDLDLAIYNTGADKKNGSGEFDQATNADNTPGTWHHVPLRLATLDGGGWEGMTVIPAYQAFQLKATASATLTIDYDKCVRGSESKNYTEPLRAPGHRAAGKSNSDIEALRLAVSDAKGIAYIYLLEGEQFSEEYDNGWELEYKPNSKYGKLYAISPEQGDMMALARPSLEGTMVGFQPGESSEYTITFNETDGYYYLNDLKMEQSTLIQAGESYTFSVEEGESANRFLISSVPFNKPGIVTGVTNPNAEAPKAQKVIYNDKLYIIRGGKVFSADGQLVK